MSFRNRCVIAGANGRINLTVPLIGGRDQRTISKEVKIDNSGSWQSQHFRSIISAYNRSPFFEHYADSLKGLFAKKFEYLFDWNLICLEWLKGVTSAKWKYSFTNSYEADFTNSPDIDLRNRFFPRTIALEDSMHLSYRQVFEETNGFIPSLSMLDFLFCAGPQAVINAAGQSPELDRY